MYGPLNTVKELVDESLANILSGCPMLESLVLIFCQHLHHIDLSKSIKLTRFEITGQYYGPSKIVAPHIRFLKLIGSLDPCILVDVSSLTDARFSLSYVGRTTAEDDFHQDMLLKMLEKLQNLENLTIGPIVLQVCFIPSYDCCSSILLSLQLCMHKVETVSPVAFYVSV